LTLFGRSFFNVKNMVPHPLMRAFKDLWKNNGEYISLQYANTVSECKSKGVFNWIFFKGSEKLLENFKNKCIYALLQIDSTGIHY